MCQVLAINNLSKVADFENLTNVIKEHITATNGDGYGMAVHSELGISAFKTVDYSVIYEPLTYQRVKDVVSTNEFEYIGRHDFTNPISAIFHGRTSTNKGGVKNAHPIMLNDQCVVHNGVVSVKSKYKQVLDTDSELLTIIQDNLKKNLESKVTGYYAFLNLFTNGTIQVVRDKIASLVIGYCPEIDSHIIATNEELLNSVVTDMDWTIKGIYKVNDNVIFTISPDNVIRDFQKFKSLGYNKKHLSLARTSLGRVIDPYDTDNYHNTTFSDVETKDMQKWAREITLNEFLYADVSWSFYHRNGVIDLHDFNRLTDDEKLECHVTDWQGHEISIEQTMIDLTKEDEFYAS